MSKFLRNFIADESGATAIEYGLIAALIAVVLIASISVLGQKVGGTFDKVGAAMPQ
ncbi:Flp family type IVb pilin [Phenylobacterium sp.]|uniref:Flp family type IVb pilin n=1 Tax=Phenylobacterium sp. TaxID=1871053 RepID=UPI00272025AC|nr:Flp family type IVb pilin [Phenylobacterium sp.]MDO8380725.1 Flp family type IVb pilin [Phenylobacterium sp.]